METISLLATPSAANVAGRTPLWLAVELGPLHIEAAHPYTQMWRVESSRVPAELVPLHITEAA